ncbi:hypothetical protein EVAR_33013_1 [Eumeta japonica]|uniref:Uncharacterized protein n=1 Tax=Eumeta variegata TaxID=151549 RepID=A0A4C1VQ93_EUMVA|nr:hypothetical protein EVAR_33013_1 [Eumeta japonica]
MIQHLGPEVRVKPNLATAVLRVTAFKYLSKRTNKLRSVINIPTKRAMMANRSKALPSKQQSPGLISERGRIHGCDFNLNQRKPLVPNCTLSRCEIMLTSLAALKFKLRQHGGIKSGIVIQIDNGVRIENENEMETGGESGPELEIERKIGDVIKNETGLETNIGTRIEFGTESTSGSQYT